MRFSLLAILLVPIYLLISPVAQSQPQKIYLHPKAAGSDKQSNYVDSIRFIPLEIKEGIDLAAYNDIEVTDSFFLIRDYMRKTILLYAKDGRFIKKISYKKLGEGFYPGYDERTNQLVFLQIMITIGLRPGTG